MKKEKEIVKKEKDFSFFPVKKKNSYYIRFFPFSKEKLYKVFPSFSFGKMGRTRYIIFLRGFATPKYYITRRNRFAGRGRAKENRGIRDSRNGGEGQMEK